MIGTLKKSICFFLMLGFASLPTDTFAQGQKFVFAEGLGGGILASANFDMRFKKQAREGFGARIGYTNIGFFDTDEGTSIIPIGVNYIHGKRRSGLLAGFNTTFAILPKDHQFSDYRSVVYGPEIGYRFRPMEKGVAFQFTWSPLFNTVDGTKAAWFGIGLGYAWR